MKKQLRVTALVLSILMVLSCTFTGTVLTASAEDAEPQTVFNAAAEFSVANGNVNGVWSYETRDIHNPKVYNALAVENGVEVDYAGVISKVSSDDVGYNGDVLMMRADNQTSDVVVTFTAPYSGIINIAMANGGIVAPYNGDDVVRFELLKNDEVIKSFYDLDNQYNYTANIKYALKDELALVVKTGDKIRFAIGRNKPADGRAFLSPVIRYANLFKTSYRAYDEFSATSNPNGVWKYMYRASSTDTDFGLLTQRDGYYELSNLGYYFVKENDKVTGLPALNLYPGGQDRELALAFVAPYTGTVEIKMSNMSVNTPSGNIRFTMMKNATVIEQRLECGNASAQNPFLGTGYFTDTKTVDVVAGDTIYFCAGRNIAASAECYIDPQITYTDFDVTSFDSYNEFSATNNPNGVWSYEYANNSLTSFGKMGWIDGENIYLMWNESVATAELSPNAGYQTLSARSHGLGYAVVTFNAPYSGTVEAKMTNGCIYCPETDGNAGHVDFALLKNTDVVRTEEISNKNVSDGTFIFTDTTEIKVKAGDKIRFAFGRTGAVNGVAYCTPGITYKSVETPEASTGNTYYVSTSGADSASGMSEFAPFATFAKLDTLNLKGGDRVFLKSGDTWNEQLVLNNISATEENPVVISSYGDGAKPVIDLQLTENIETPYSELAIPAVTLKNCQGIEIRNLKITGTGVGIDLHYENSYNNEYVKIADCDFVNITGFNQVDNRERGVEDRYYLASAVTTTYFNTNIAVTDPALIGLYIEGCTTNGCGSLYVNGDSSIYNLNESGATAVSGLYIKNCDMIDNDYYGAFINGVNGGYMDGCTVTGCGAASNFTPGTAGILLATKNFIVQNTVVENQKRGGMPYDGVGIDFEQSNENVIVRNCYIKDNAGAGVMIYDSNNFAPNVNCKIINNIFEQNADEATDTILHHDFDCDIRIIATNGYCFSGSEISGNIWYNDRGTHEFIYSNQSTPAVANTIENNEYSDNYDGFTPDAALSASVAEEVAPYVGSNHTVDVRKETTVSGEIVKTDIYAHTGSEKNSAVWGRKYFDGSWKDMTLNEIGDVFYWSYGTGGEVDAINGTAAPAVRETGAVTFTAPKAGRVKLSLDGGIVSRQCPPNWDGVSITVFNDNKEQICDQVVLGNGLYENNLDGDVYYNIAAGETIYFAFTKNQSNYCDSIVFKPVVEYCDQFGSINDDEAIDVTDIVRLKKYIANNETVVSQYADINGDGDINGYDLVDLKKYILGLF